MYRMGLLLLLIVFAASPAWTQETSPDATEEAAETDTQDADDVTDEDIEELLGLGDEDYTELEDDFDPTEEVRFEQSIPFPTDI
jgi:hypothetical protein